MITWYSLVHIEAVPEAAYGSCRKVGVHSITTTTSRHSTLVDRHSNLGLI